MHVVCTLCARSPTRRLSKTERTGAVEAPRRLILHWCVIKEACKWKLCFDLPPADRPSSFPFHVFSIPACCLHLLEPPISQTLFPRLLRVFLCSFPTRMRPSFGLFDLLDEGAPRRETQGLRSEGFPWLMKLLRSRSGLDDESRTRAGGGILEQGPPPSHLQRISSSSGLQT